MCVWGGGGEGGCAHERACVCACVRACVRECMCVCLLLSLFFFLSPNIVHFCYVYKLFLLKTI